MEEEMGVSLCDRVLSEVLRSINNAQVEMAMFGQLNKG